jgi:hypothetical protein
VVALHRGRADGRLVPDALEARQGRGRARDRAEGRWERGPPALQLTSQGAPAFEELSLGDADGGALAGGEGVPFRVEGVAGGDEVGDLAEEPVDLVGAGVLLDVGSGVDVAGLDEADAGCGCGG